MPHQMNLSFSLTQQVGSSWTEETTELYQLICYVNPATMADQGFVINLRDALHKRRKFRQEHHHDEQTECNSHYQTWPCRHGLLLSSQLTYQLVARPLQGSIMQRAWKLSDLAIHVHLHSFRLSGFRARSGKEPTLDLELRDCQCMCKHKYQQEY